MIIDFNYIMIFYDEHLHYKLKELRGVGDLEGIKMTTEEWRLNATKLLTRLNLIC